MCTEIIISFIDAAIVFNKTKELLKLALEALFPADGVSLTLSRFSTLAGQR